MKWFAENLPNATTWGEKLEGATFRVVEIQVRTSAYEQWYRVARLDSIGPAVVAEIPALNDALVGTIRTIR